MKTLTAGEKVWVCHCETGRKPIIRLLEIKSFIPGLRLIAYTNGLFHHFTKYSFYASGYSCGGGFAIVTRHQWQIPLAWLLDKIRLLLPVEIAELLGLEDVE